MANRLKRVIRGKDIVNGLRKPTKFSENPTGVKKVKKK